MLFGTQNASEKSLEDIDSSSSTGNTLETGLVGAVKAGQNTSSGLSTMWIVLISIGAVLGFFGLIMAISPKARRGVKRFFTELTAGIFKKKNKSKV